MAPYIKRVLLGRLAPQRVAVELYRLALDLKRFLSQFPKDLLEVSRLIRQQRFQLKFDSQEFTQTLAKLDQISNRLAFSVIIGSLIVGSALIVQSNIPPLIFGISMIGIIGFGTAAVMGFWLLIAILRKGRL